MSNKQVTITGQVKRVSFSNPDTGYTVAKLEVDGQGPVTVVGKLPGVAEGQNLELTGREVLHPKFGHQVEIDSFQLSQPSDEQGIRRYLASGMIPGLGPKLAERVVDHLGCDAVEAILGDPSCLRQVPGIGAKRSKSITQALREQGELRELMVFLQSHDVGAGLALRIFRQYGAGALDLVRREPHRLAADVRGIGFATADRIAAKLGISHDDPSRIRAGLEHVLDRALGEGHVFLPYDELVEKATGLLDVERGLLGPAFARLHNDGRIVLEDDALGRPVYLAPMHALESRAAQGFARLGRGKGLLPTQRADKACQWVAGRLGFAPSSEQTKALHRLLTAGLGVLTGGPGTGKTTLVQALITIARRMDVPLALAAPTGRAAKRLAESTGMEASTIHRLLEYSPKEGGFLRNTARPLEAKLVVIDESSMLDTWLAAHLVEATAPGCRLILVGDANQLPSVGPGLVLQQVMASPASAVAQLTQIFRQDSAGLIVANAHRVLAGEMPQAPPTGQEADFYLISQQDPEKAAALVRDLVCRRLPERFGLDPASDIQVLTPMHRGSLGTRRINQMIRQELNPAAGGSPQLAPGDKVMQSRNNYDLEVFNGDLGLVRERREGGLGVEMGGRMVGFGLADLEQLALAYAVSVHKSQGSEFPAVVIALGSEHYVMLNRPLIYTALTRGQRLVVVVGHPAALKRAVENAEPIMRHARLDERIKAAITKGKPIN